MYKETYLLKLNDPSQSDQIKDRLREIAEGSPQIARHFLSTPLKGSFRGGHIMWQPQFENADAHKDFRKDDRAQQNLNAVISPESDICGLVERIAYKSSNKGFSDKTLKDGVYRVLFIRVEPHAREDQVEQFVDDFSKMAGYIPAIRNWGMNAVDEGSGTYGWTHIWEQEYQTLNGLTDDYMNHPYHWSHIDRWFDPECNCRIVGPKICHSFCTIDHSIMAH